jgi:hypothetical protein
MSLGGVICTKLQENEVDWAQGFFFSLTVRGTKHATQHSMDAHSASQALDEFLADAKISRDATAHGSWYIDVGVEYSASDTCLQWTTSSHFHTGDIHTRDTRHTPVTDITRHSPTPPLSHPPGASTATHIADTITLAADTATGDSTAMYGAETTHQLPDIPMSALW